MLCPNCEILLDVIKEFRKKIKLLEDEIKLLETCRENYIRREHLIKRLQYALDQKTHIKVISSGNNMDELMQVIRQFETSDGTTVIVRPSGYVTLKKDKKRKCPKR